MLLEKAIILLHIVKQCPIFHPKTCVIKVVYLRIRYCKNKRRIILFARSAYSRIFFLDINGILAALFCLIHCLVSPFKKLGIGHRLIGGDIHADT